MNDRPDIAKAGTAGIGLERVGLGGGCHWCTEAVFQSLRGVSRVEQGFIAAEPPHDSRSEAVIVHYDLGVIGLETLIEVHLRTHAATSRHKLRGKYRSAVYAFDAEQAKAARAVLTALQADFEQPLVTRVLRFAGFTPSDPRFVDYYQSDPDRPFCRRHIDPKLATLRRDFSRHATPRRG